MNDIAKIVVFSITAYVSIFIIAKLLGKKQIAQLSFIDYIVGITIGSIAAEMTTELEQPFYHYLIAMALFFLFDLAVTLIGRKSALLKKIVTGKPLIIINDGKIDYKVLKQSKLTVDEVQGLARDKNIFDLNDVAYAVLETKGTLSILPKAAKTPVVAENINVELPEPSLSQSVVIDGKPCRDTLKTLNKDVSWLLEKAGAKNESDLDGIILATYGENKDALNVWKKDGQ